ncbi:MAG: ribonuclease HII [Thermodesulfobacteriota bacterium]
MRLLDYSIEKEFWLKNKIPAGVDEAGRGPLAGPVVAAAVILCRSNEIQGLNDSKKLSPTTRERLFSEIKEKALFFGIGIVDNEEIDRINILQAALKAMELAVGMLPVKPDFLIIDGNQITSLSIPQRAIVKGDSKCASIAAASILAKVTRDRIMMEFDREYPDYNFSKHKGYPTKDHYEMLKKFGHCPIHRKTFKGVL